jgi:hypothetical protein
MNILTDGVLDQLVFEDLRVRELHDPHGRSGNLRQSCGPEATCASDDLKAVQIEFADDQRNKDALGPDTLGEFLELRLIETPAWIRR